MRHILVLALFITTITGCNQHELKSQSVTRDYGQEIDDLLSRIGTIEEQLVLLNSLVISLSVDVETLTDLVKVLKLQLENSTGDLETRLENVIADLELRIDVTESQVNTLISRIAILESTNGLTIVEIIDPCGDSAGLDEVLLKMSDGTILAWLKNVGIVELTNGSYITTDSQKCVFSVLDGIVN